ncbi:MAG TPA: hypothetical protein VFP62_05405 [Burkholderiales bacterium]|jgi:hypothetical protein|nr:hypothetical protein [Burkholderiales bacterium]
MKRKTTKSGNLSALYVRLDAVRMSQADRANAKAALAQADAVADAVLAIADFVNRLFSARPLHPTSAHS